MKYTTNSEFKSEFLGLVEYSEADALQIKYLESARILNQNFILGLEHPAVITLGLRARQEDQIIQSPTIPVVKSNRGGLATIHSEGQLVIYPIINLKKLNWGVRDYVLLLLKITSETLNELKIDNRIDTENVGVFTNAGKIAFCGVQVKNGISLHGVSINVNNNLQLFDQIISCGFKKPKLDLISNYRPEMTTRNLYNIWIEKFNKSVH